MPDAKHMMAAAALLFVVMMANAQAVSLSEGNRDESMPSGQTAENSRVPKTEVSAGSFQRFSRMRKGRSQEVGVFLCRPTPRLPDCALHLMDVDDQPLPVLLEMEPAEGFTIQYGDGSHYKSKQPGKAYNLADRRIVFLKLHASSGLTSGEYTLKGSLVYRMSGGTISYETSRVPVEIRVRVVDHDAGVTRLEWPYGSHPTRAFKNVVTGFVAVPFWTGYLLYAGAYCALSDCK